MSPEPIIDGHRHILCREAQEAAARLNRTKSNDYLGGIDPLSAEVNRERAKSWNRKMTDPDELIEDLVRAGMHMAVLQPPPIGFYYWAEPAAGAELARMTNENTARYMRKHPDRFFGLATLPLQATDLALKELRHAVGALGLKGIALTSNINGRGLDQEEFLPFFEEAAKLNLPLFIHPDNAPGADRMGRYYLTNFLGYPLDTTLAASLLVFGGVLDRYPDLKVCLAHGGGVLPFLLGRLEHGGAVRPEAGQHCRLPFSSYLKNFYVDSVTFRPEILRFVLSVMPEGHTFLGTDYPFDMGDPDAVAHVKAAVSDRQGRLQIFSGTLKELLGISSGREEGT